MTQLGCPHCGTGLTGSFESCEFCGLDQADRDLLRVFLVSRGNMKDLERHLGVSYPTARQRYADVLTRLGLEPVAPPVERRRVFEDVAAGRLGVDEAESLLRGDR